MININDLNQVQIKFTDRSTPSKIALILKWLAFSIDKIQDILSRKTVVEANEIPVIENISEAFADDNINTNLIKNYLTSEALKKLEKTVTEIKLKNVFHCGNCNGLLKSDCVRCDLCLIWFHFKCAFETVQSPLYKAAVIDGNDWYCTNCDKNYQ